MTNPEQSLDATLTEARECLDLIERDANNAIVVQRNTYAAARELLLLFLRSGGSDHEVQAMAQAVVRETAEEDAA